MTLERYLKQTIIPQISTVGQKKLLNSHILIVGGGGLAVPVIQYLAGAGIGSISVVDGDKVSLDNLHRQTLFKEKDIGNFKVDVLKNFVNNLNSSINLNVFNFYANPSNIQNLCLNVDIVVDCADNFATTYFLSDLCFERKICFITASVSLFSGYVGTFCKNAPSVRAIFPDLPNNNKSCNTEGVLGTSVGMIGSLQAQLVIFYLLKINNTIGQLYILNTENFRVSKFDFLDAKEPKKSFKFLSKNKIKNDDLVYDLRDEMKTDNLVTSNAFRCSLEEYIKEVNIPSKRHNRVVFCCKTGLRAWKAAKKLEMKWQGEIYLLAEQE